ncbi:MAG: hypothetical protein GY943_30390 [Chloroflexi bacterium]|nr:hypothetical protein [Chloroflexota bacterium]
MTKPTFELSIDTRLLYELLKSCEVNETVTYVQLSKEIGQPVEGANSSLQSALRKCMTQDDIVFENVRGEGYKRLNDIDIVSASERDTTGIRKRARKAAKKLTLVTDFAALPQDKKIEHNTRLSILSAITSAASRKSENKISAAVTKQGHELPFAATLEAFKS